MITGEEITESAKAVQAVAKTTDSAIKASEKVGGFLSRVLGGSIEQASGILEDRLKVVRFERQMRLVERVEGFLGEKGVVGDWKPVPPKLALPILENASWEENDELQDIWARLLSSALDPNFDGTMRTAFIDIARQLEVSDVHVLNLIHLEYSRLNEKSVEKGERELDPEKVSISKRQIREGLGLDEGTYRESVDNLLRQRCVASFVATTNLDIPRKTQVFPASGSRSSFSQPSMRQLLSVGSGPRIQGDLETRKVPSSVAYTYDNLTITALGISFVRACLG